MKVVIFGGSGMVGGGVLLECLDERGFRVARRRLGEMLLGMQG